MDAFDLHRFVDAQSRVYDSVTSELRAGRKRSHWMWFIFPQIRGLGLSAAAQRFAISGLDEARAYLEHPILGARLRECARILAELPDQPIERIMGYPDNLKLRSSMTLFARAAPDEPLFTRVLEKYFSGQPDPLTLARLDEAPGRMDP